MNFTKSTLDVTTMIGCPVACVYCPQDKIKNYKGEHLLTIETFGKCLDKIPKTIDEHGFVFPRIEFSGFVEPYTNPHCSELIILAYQKGFTNITLYTTLRGMHLDDFEKIKKIPLLFVSIHLPDTDGYTKIPVNDEYFELLGKLIDQYDIGFFAYGNIRQDVIDFIVNKRPNAMNGDFKWDLHIHSRAGNLDMVPPIDFQHGSIQCCKSTYLELNNNVLMPNGDVALCCMDFGVQHILGNLLTDEYMDLFKSEEHNKIAAGMLVEEMNTMCRICNFAIPNTKNK